MTHLQPFWRYYGGKWAAARHYPEPRRGVIIEPFAGAAGYATWHHRRGIVLVERNPVVAAVWRWLIEATPADVLAVGDIPDGGTVDDIDAPQAARWLAGFWCNSASVNPRKRQSAWARRGADVTNWAGWNRRSRGRIARQVPQIKHWTVIEGDYTAAPDVEATWFVDPPYCGRAGRHYPVQPESFDDLGLWCRGRRGQVMVCEQHGAEWLPFEAFRVLRSAIGTHRPSSSREVIWTNTPPAQANLFGGAS